VRHSPEDHYVDQIVGLRERLVAGLALTPAARQVGDVDDEAAFLGRDRIDGPLQEVLSRAA
jgi:hypothetical protein